MNAKSEQQKNAEIEVESYRRNLGPFVVAAETTRMPMVFTDAREPHNPIVFANDSFLRLTGYTRDEVLGRDLTLLLTSFSDNDLAALETGSIQQCYHKDGSIFWADIFVAPVPDEHGVNMQHFVSFFDVTRHRQEQARAQVLIDELNHRVKNTLTTVQAIVWQVLRAEQQTPICDAIESRLFAMSRTHDLLDKSHWVDIGLFELVTAILAPFKISERSIAHGDPINLTPKIALALGFAVHELAMNAVQHGAFSLPTGSVQITWRVAGPSLALHWQERDGPLVLPPSRKGFGSQVIERGLPHELGATVTLDYAADGVGCTIHIPLSGESR